MFCPTVRNWDMLCKNLSIPTSYQLPPRYILLNFAMLSSQRHSWPPTLRRHSYKHESSFISAIFHLEAWTGHWKAGNDLRRAIYFHCAFRTFSLQLVMGWCVNALFNLNDILRMVVSQLSILNRTQPIIFRNILFCATSIFSKCDWRVGKIDKPKKGQSRFDYDPQSFIPELIYCANINLRYCRGLITQLLPFTTPQNFFFDVLIRCKIISWVSWKWAPVKFY